MEQKPWSKAKLAEWKSFWESPMGMEAIEKMLAIKQMCLDHALRAETNEAICGLVGRAAGIDLILNDIKQGILQADESQKKGGKKTGSK